MCTQKYLSIIIILCQLLLIIPVLAAFGFVLHAVSFYSFDYSVSPVCQIKVQTRYRMIRKARSVILLHTQSCQYVGQFFFIFIQKTHSFELGIKKNDTKIVLFIQTAHIFTLIMSK